MKVKIPKLPRPKKLRAATARRSGGASAGMDYEEISEPNMRLSRALLIVLLLHVVAVSGIIAFNAIKTRQSERSVRFRNRSRKTTTRNQATTGHYPHRREKFTRWSKAITQ